MNLMKFSDWKSLYGYTIPTIRNRDTHEKQIKNSQENPSFFKLFISWQFSVSNHFFFFSLTIIFIMFAQSNKYDSRYLWKPGEMSLRLRNWRGIISSNVSSCVHICYSNHTMYLSVCYWLFLGITMSRAHKGKW